jgi:hypothetical protein
MGISYNPSAVTDGLLYGVDFANTKNYVGSGSSFTDSVISRAGTLTNASYYSYDSATKSINFTRDGSTLVGGYTNFVGTDGLTSTNFLYNNHSVELLARVNDFAPGNYNGNETNSVLAGYQGYHAGFQYTASGLFYSIWNGTSNSSVTVPIANTPVNTWIHLVATRLGNLFTMYVNGVSVNTGTVATASGNPGITNNFRLAAGNAGSGPYAYYAKCNVALHRMYNKALSAAEVQQNFNSVRGRYGL